MRAADSVPESRPATGATVTVLGEAVVDLVREPDGRFVAHPGGSPLNVAVGLARLDVPTTLLARFSTARFGRWLRAHAETNGVDLRHTVDTDEPATLAIASLTGDGVAGYDFYVDGTADWQWRAEELTPALTGRGILHTGSLAVFRSPGADRLAAALRTARHRGTLISLDPNIRPGLVGTPAEARTRIDGLVRLAHVVKASEEDIAWLYPNRSAEAVLRHWLARRGHRRRVAVRRGGCRRHLHPCRRRPAVPARPADNLRPGLADLDRAGAAHATARETHASAGDARPV